MPFGENYSKETIENLNSNGEWIIQEKLILAKQANQFEPLTFLFDFEEDTSLEERVTKRSGMCLNQVLAKQMSQS